MTQTTTTSDLSTGSVPLGPPATTMTRSPLGARAEQVVLLALIVVPLLALLAAVPVAWGWGLGWQEIVLVVVLYAITGHGITVGFHRYLTHGAFKAKRGAAGGARRGGKHGRRGAGHPLGRRPPPSPRVLRRRGRSALAMALRRGSALAQGHVPRPFGWLFDAEQTDQQRFAPDLLRDRSLVGRAQALRRADRHQPAAPGVGRLCRGLVLAAALEAFFWAGLVRIGLLHHVTWSVNSICHTVGKRRSNPRPVDQRLAAGDPGDGRDWHNLHHAEPTSARHGVQRGQLDTSARLIRAFERLGLATSAGRHRNEWLPNSRSASSAADYASPLCVARAVAGRPFWSPDSHEAAPAGSARCSRPAARSPTSTSP